MIEIVKAGHSDYETVHKLAKKIWPHTYNKILAAEQLDYMFDMMYSAQSFTDQLAIQGHQYLLAKEDGIYLAFASYEVNYLSGSTKIHKLYVLPEAQRRGVGKVLVTKLENIARKHNNDKLVLNVNRYNQAVLFYTSLGFVKTGEEDVAIGNGYLMEDFIMAKNI